MKKYQVEVEVTKTYKALVEVEITEDIDGDDFQRVVEEEVESMDQEKLDYKETNHLVLKLMISNRGVNLLRFIKIDFY